MEPDQPNGKSTRQHSSKVTGKNHILIKKLLIILLCGLAAVGLLVGLYGAPSNTSLVPQNIQKAVNFSVYYPVSFPSGYTLDAQSFRLAESGVVLFSVNYDDGKDIVFSEEQQPSSAEMDKFISNYVPLNSALELPLGQAKVGAYGSAPNIRTVVSLPIHSGPWLIATAPSEVSHDDLVKILSSLTK